MKDGIIAETGDSRYLRTIAGALQKYPTYETFLTALIAGEFPIDWAGKNPDGWAQQGTELNKANLLTDATAALMDLGPEATPNEMLAALANMLKTVRTTANSAQSAAQVANSKITYGTASLTAGSSNLATGTIYVKYE